MNEAVLEPWTYWTEPERVDVSGVPTAYRRKGSGEPLLYLHGAGLTRRWLPLYEELSQSFDVIVPEHLGFGDTPMPEWLSSFDDMVLHYAELLDQLAVGPAHVVGHSLGGWIAAEFACFYPERVRSLTLITPIGLRGALKADVFRLSPEDASEVLFNGQPERYAEYLEGGDQVDNIVHDYGERITMARLMWNPRYSIKLERRLQRVGAPATIVLPDDDRLINHDVAARYAEHLPNGEIVTVSGDDAPTGHLLIVQEPRKVADVVADTAAKAE